MSNSTLWSIALSIVFLGWMVYWVMNTGNDDAKFRAKGIKIEARITNKKT